MNGTRSGDVGLAVDGGEAVLESVAGSVDGHDVAVVQEAVDIDTDLERLSRSPDTVPEQTITSPHGGLTARLRSGGIVAVTSDPARIAGLDAGQLQFEARSLLRTCAVVRSRNRS